MSEAQESAPIEHETAVAVVPPQTAGLSPMVQAILSGQMTPDQMQAVLNVQKDYEKNEAEKAFHQALAAFKTHDITLDRDKKVSYKTDKGTTEYRHTSLGAALKIISPLLSEHGLSLSWVHNQDMQHGGLITVTCVLSHALGHSISTSLTASPDASGGKNNIQAIGSTVSYLERYTAFSLIGVASMDQDDDGNSAGGADKPACITEEQANTIHAKITDNELDMSAFIRWLKKSVKAEAIKDIRAPAFNTVMHQIDATIKARKAKEQTQ